MKRLVAILCVSAMSLSLFAGCGSSAEETEITSAAVEETAVDETEAETENENADANEAEGASSSDENANVNANANDAGAKVDTTALEEVTKDVYAVILCISQEKTKLDADSSSKFTELGDEMQKYSEEVAKDETANSDQSKVDEITEKFNYFKTQFMEIANKNNITVKTLEELIAEETTAAQ